MVAVAAAATVVATTGGAAAPVVGTALTSVTLTPAAAVTVGATTGGTALANGVAAAVALGPIGWLLLGAEGQEVGGLTFDCWKPILHDESIGKSTGMLLRDVVMDARVNCITIDIDGTIILKNIWEEHYLIQYVKTSPDTLALHAIQLN